MYIKLNISELSKFPTDKYTAVNIFSGEIPELLEVKAFDCVNLAYKDNEMCCKTNATIEQLNEKGIEYIEILEIPENFKQLVFPTSEKEYYTISETEIELNKKG